MCKGETGWWEQISWHSMAYEVLQDGGSESVFLDSWGTKLCSNQKNNIILDTANSDIVLDFRIKTRDCWVAGVDLIHEWCGEKAHVSKKKSQVLIKYQNHKDINELHIVLEHSSKEIKKIWERLWVSKWQVWLKLMKIVPKAEKANVKKGPLKDQKLREKGF